MIQPMSGEHFSGFHRHMRHPNRRKSGYRKMDKRNRHHLVNKVRGGDFSPENISLLKIWKHNQWHCIFKNSDPEYVVAVLTRWLRMRRYHNEHSETLLEVS